VTVRRRLVVYVQGYDPRGLPEYYRMFRQEFRKTLALYGLSGQVGKPVNDPERFITAWGVETHGSGWDVATRYMFLRWEDIIRRDFARPAWWKMLHMYLAMSHALVHGVIWRLLKAHWRFGLFVLYPMVLMTLWVLAGAIFGFGVARLAAWLGLPAWAADLAGAAFGFAAFAAALGATEKHTYLLYLCDDIASTWQFAHRRRPDWEARLDLFAGYLVDAVKDTDADEVVVVGHSSGSFLAVEVVDRALARDPGLGHHGPALRLLTIGANLPIIGFHARAQWFRDRLLRLSRSAEIAWVDFQSRHDIMNLWPFDPIADHGIDAGSGRRNPTVVAISFRDIWHPEGFGRRRWRFFRAHFQFLLANERTGAPYDYYLICCGPEGLAERAAAASNTPGRAPELPESADLV
jgi:hypothetical protein